MKLISRPNRLYGRELKAHKGDSGTCVLDDDWGLSPALALVGSLGLLLVALAGNLASAASLYADVTFWIGLIVIFAPIAVRLLGDNLSQYERAALITVLAVELYLVKVLHSPTSFTFYDELLHWRAAQDILTTGRLFTQNPLLPVSSFYPGIEVVTAAVVALGETSIFAAGVIVVGAARLLLILALFQFYKSVSQSSRIASIACLVYIANPAFLFFNAQFSYESLALPLGAMALLAAALRCDVVPAAKTNMGLLAVVGIAATVVTHHLTSFMLLAFLVLWAMVSAGIDKRSTLLVLARIVDWYSGRVSTTEVFRQLPDPETGTGRSSAEKATAKLPFWIPFLAVVLNFAWLLIIAVPTMSYLTSNISEFIDEAINLVTSGSGSRQPFTDLSGQTARGWEQLIGYIAILVLLLSLPVGLRRIWHSERQNALAVCLGLVALMYPMSLVLRLTERGLEIAGRTPEFLFVGVAFVSAMAVVELGSLQRVTLGRMGISFLLIICFVGGIVLGWLPWMRLPGPYMVAADSRSIEPESVLMAEWTRDNLGPNNRIVADRTNRVLLGAYGRQWPVTASYEFVDISSLFISENLGADEESILHSGRIRYIVIDRRLLTGLPRVGVYYEVGEFGSQREASVLNPQMFEKFEFSPQLQRVFDSGNVIIYRVSGE